jgi:large subunit ribosomal protein L3
MTNSLLATKVGMTQVYDAAGVSRAATVLSVGPCRAGLVRSAALDGYSAVQVQLVRNDKVLATRESRLDADSVGLESGQFLAADFIEVGGKVDVIGTSKGRGTAGVMKRHNFAGQRASHGVKKVHRHPGSTGMSADPARVIKGTKMAGRYGAVRATVRNLVVLEYTAEDGLLAVSGAVPGPNGGLVEVRRPVEL